MDSESFLTILLSVTLFVFLVLAIALLFYVLKVVRSVKRITDKAEVATDNLSKVSQKIKVALTPVAIMEIFSKFRSSKAKHSSNNKKKE